MSTDKMLDSLTHALWDTNMVVTRLLMGTSLGLTSLQLDDLFSTAASL